MKDYRDTVVGVENPFQTLFPLPNGAIGKLHHDRDLRIVQTQET